MAAEVTRAHDPDGRDLAPDAARALPKYDRQLSDFHRAFEPELEGLLRGLPLTPTMRVLDLACGDGFYARRIADRLGPGGSVTGVDRNLAYLSAARAAAVPKAGRAPVYFVDASFDRLPFPDDTFDFVWCAQSLQSLREPVMVLRHLGRVLRPGGIVAILENDTMHQVCLPWPIDLELQLRAAELRALSQGAGGSSRFYIARRLSAVLAVSGLEPMHVTTCAIDRRAPLGEAERALLSCYLEEIEARVSPYLDASSLGLLRALCDPSSSEHMLRDPYLTMTWINVLALGRKPKDAGLTNPT